MRRWTRNPHANFRDDVDSLATPPSGGKVKRITLGIALPAALLCIAANAWITEEATWFGRNMNLRVRGDVARSLAVAWLGGGLFCHSRWFWGLLPNAAAFSVGTAFSLLLIAGGLLYGMYRLVVW